MFVAAFEIDAKLPTALGFSGAFVCAKPFGAALVAGTNQIALAAVAKIRLGVHTRPAASQSSRTTHALSTLAALVGRTGFSASSAM